MRFLLLFKINRNWSPVFVDFKLYFSAFKIYGAIVKTSFSENLSNFIQLKYFFSKITFPAFNNFLNFFVSKSAIAFDNGMNNFVAFYISIFVDLKNDRKSQFFFIRAK